MFFSLSAAKQDLYIFPIVPAVAALAGSCSSRAATGAELTAVARTCGDRCVIGAAAGRCGSRARFTLFEAVGKVYALDGAAFVGARRPSADAAALGARAAPTARVRRWPSSLVSLVALNWVFVIAGAAELRSVQAGACARRRNRTTRRARRRSWSRTTTSRCRAWCITSAGTSRFCSIADAFLELLRRRSGDVLPCCRRGLHGRSPASGVRSCSWTGVHGDISSEGVLAREPLPEVPARSPNRCEAREVRCSR